jgi:hypothetical protein
VSNLSGYQTLRSTKFDVFEQGSRKTFGPATQFMNRRIIAAPYDGVPLFGLPPFGSLASDI